MNEVGDDESKEYGDRQVDEIDIRQVYFILKIGFETLVLKTGI